MNDARRIRSPNYPALDLRDALARVEVVFERERQHSMSKDVALKGLGYSSANGAALGTLSAVLKYGLLERVGENYRVSDRTVAILHPKTPDEKEQALREAALSPPLFAELAGEFPGGQVSDDNLRSYLIRNSFSSSAVTGVIKAFRETMQMVSFDEASPPAQPLLPAPTSHQVEIRPMHVQPVQPASQPPFLISIDGQAVTVQARLENAQAVDKLIRVLEANKLLLPEKPNDQQNAQIGDASTQH